VSCEQARNADSVVFVSTAYSFKVELAAHEEDARVNSVVLRRSLQAFAVEAGRSGKGAVQFSEHCGILRWRRRYGLAERNEVGGLLEAGAGWEEVGTDEGVELGCETVK